MDNLIYLVNIILGVLSFAVALKIRHEKSSPKPMLCPLNMRCEEVTHSKYANFLGIPIEILGMFYYGLSVISYTIFLFAPALRNPLFIFAIFLMSTGGFLFSAYLVSVQAFKLKEWCSLCLISAGTSTAIFILLLQTDILSVVLATLAHGYTTLVIISYSLALSIGLSITILLEALLLYFLKDSTISEGENHILHILRQATWFLIGVMAITNFLMYSMDPSLPSASFKFSTKIFILSFLIIANLIHDFFVSSKLIEIFSNRLGGRPITSGFLKKLALLFGPLSIILWLLILVIEII